MKVLSTLVLTLLASTALALPASALNLKVDAGESYRLHSGVTLLDLDTLVLQDGSTLYINNGEPSVMIRARHVKIGSDVRIIGVGTKGKAGDMGLGYNNAATDCAQPLAGQPGGKGQDGSNGVNLNLDWTIVSFGSLSVDLQGGPSGAGGRGGNGQAADQNPNCALQRGGDAGAGGASGSGGAGGDLTYVYRGLNDDTQAFFAKDRTHINTSAGITALSGPSGEPGEGSPGRYVKKKTLSGNKSWVGGGKPGRKVKPHKPGAPGVAGKAFFQLANPSQPSSRVASLPAASNTSDMEARISRLEQQLKILSERVVKLESQN